ncbi:DUF4242 domain-containing protein [Dokdonella sp. MW10]|uniref:DUF4242 domain-containing protein n=1 Tax=Dokdonella sp. MW10 TaxID=2992926 RepID=UPI003F7DD710
MQRFMIERDLPGAGALPDAVLRLIARKSLAARETSVQWLYSYVTENRFYCICIAADEDAVREHARRCGLPVDRIARIRSLIDPANEGPRRVADTLDAAARAMCSPHSAIAASRA